MNERANTEEKTQGSFLAIPLQFVFVFHPSHSVVSLPVSGKKWRNTSEIHARREGNLWSKALIMRVREGVRKRRDNEWAYTEKGLKCDWCLWLLSCWKLTEKCISRIYHKHIESLLSCFLPLPSFRILLTSVKGLTLKEGENWKPILMPLHLNPLSSHSSSFFSSLTERWNGKTAPLSFRIPSSSSHLTFSFIFSLFLFHELPLLSFLILSLSQPSFLNWEGWRATHKWRIFHILATSHQMRTCENPNERAINIQFHLSSSSLDWSHLLLRHLFLFVKSHLSSPFSFSSSHFISFWKEREREWDEGCFTHSLTQG